MPPKEVVRPQQPDSGLSWLGLLLVIFFAALGELFVDKKAEEERAEQRALYMRQTVLEVRDVAAGSMANGLNALLQHVTHFMQTAGIQVGLPVNTVTPEGIMFVAQWVLLLLICYGVINIAFLLFTFFLRCLWWQLKVGVALACFGLILNDNSVSKETMAIRLLCLGSVWILYSIRPWRNRTMSARIVYLEERVKISENRVREMERWRSRFAILSCCLVGLLCFLAFIVYEVCTVKSNSNAL